MRKVAILGLLAALVVPSSARAVITPAFDQRPLVVVALIDTGINPYSPAFRDDSAQALDHPSTYLDGYPRSAKALNLSLNERTLAAALKKDAKVWRTVEARTLYYVPGTKIVGLISMGDGGRRCNREAGGQELPMVPPLAPLAINSGPDCPERLLLDDHGHGTMTASRATGAPSSLAPQARVVMIEGLGTGSSRWAAEQGWIDVQSNSWGSLVPAPADRGTMATFAEIAGRHMVLIASGNGTAFSGVAPQPTYTNGLAAPGVIQVGGHDNGRVTAWAGAPAHVVADAFAPSTALHDSLAKMRPDPVACCTSTAAPYAAGAAARILLEARTILGDDGVGVRDGVAARGPKGLVERGPLKDGRFTLAEWQDVLLRTAEARPREGRDDGTLHFLGGPGAPTYPEWGSGENPYCQFCWTAPIPWSQVPAEYPAYLQIGYGATNERSVARALKVLRGTAALPARPDEDAFFAQDRGARDALWGP